jgi:hypothetical protein
MVANVFASRQLLEACFELTPLQKTWFQISVTLFDVLEPNFIIRPFPEFDILQKGVCLTPWSKFFASACEKHFLGETLVPADSFD